MIPDPKLSYLKKSETSVSLHSLSFRTNDYKYEDWMYSEFIKTNSNSALYETFCEGVFNGELDELKNKLKESLGCEVHYEYLTETDHFFLFADYSDFKKIALLRRIKSNDETLEIHLYVVSTDRKDCEQSKEALKPFLTKKKTDGVYVISNKRTGLSLYCLGKLEYSFIKDNYENKVIEGYDYIVNQYNQQQPYGRLSIINGPAGSGKTNFLKGIMTEVKNSLIVLLPSKFVSDIDSPGLISLLTEEKADKYGIFSEHGSNNVARMPILFIIEDADQCLVPRGPDNMSMISSLLNYTDGIFGSMLDLRIIATTNAEKVDIDSALTRPGRLCRHVEIGTLSPEKAEEVYKRLANGKEKYYPKPVTLAEVYKDVNGGFKSAEIEKSIVGFGK